MANLNIAEWSPEQVAEWISGLESRVSRYAGRLKAGGLDGARLLALRCDDLQYLGVHIIGHQELLLEAVEHLRNFHYEIRRECVQQLAVRVSSAGAGLARALRAGGCGGGGGGGALDTQALADVARLVSCVKPLACWLDRWPLCSAPALNERKVALLKLALEAATCAQRDRFAEQPARAVAASAAAAAASADYIIQDVSDPGILSPATLEAVQLKQGHKPLGFALLPSAGGHRQLAHVRFGSPAHASGQIHDGDEIVQVGDQCVVGWGGAAVEARCAAAAARGGELPLRLRRRGARPPPRAPAPPKTPALAPPEQSSDESEALSPPASPTQLHLHHTRMYPPKPRATPQRRHSVSGGSPVAKRPNLSIEQFWRELKEQHWERGGAAGGSAGLAGHEDDCGLYRRDKAVSCSTGLEMSPRPRTCLGVALQGPGGEAAPPSPHAGRRGKLDKAHSTPTYDLCSEPAPRPATPPATPIPESPPAQTDALPLPGQLSPAGSDLEDGPVEAINARVVDIDLPPPPPRRAPPSDFPPLRIVPRQVNTAEPHHDSESPSISVPLRHLTKLDIRVLAAQRRRLPALNADPDVGGAGGSTPTPTTPTPDTSSVQTVSSGGTGRGIFPSAKTRSLKKKNSLLAKRRDVAWRAVLGRGAVPAGGPAAGGAAGAVWQRVRARGAALPRWARRHLLLAHNVLYAYRSPECSRADCMIQLAGFTASAAAEVRSKAHAFKVYHTGTAFYFAADSRDAMLAWLALLARATLAPLPSALDISKQYSETDYSETESDAEHPTRCSEKERDRERERDREKDKDKSKFGSLKKLTSRMARWESSEAVGAASLDRKYLRFFSRHRKDDEPKSKAGSAVVPTQHYRSYRRPAAPAPAPAPALEPASPPSPPMKLKAARFAHASNPNLAGAGSADWRVRGATAGAGGGGRPHLEHLLGFVTLEEFMLKKQEEERKQVYTNRVLMGIERPSLSQNSHKEIQKQLECIVPDVMYGELPDNPAPAPAPRAVQAGSKPISITGKDGYEKIVYPGEMDADVPPSPSPGSTPGTPERWRDSLRRNYKESSSPRRPVAVPPQYPQYPHLQCPPTFQAETYSLAHLQNRTTRPNQQEP